MNALEVSILAEYTVKEFVLYSLTPETRANGDDDWSRKRLKPFSQAQYRVLLGFLEWLRTDTEFICDIEDVDARVARFNQLWATRWDA